MWRGIVTLSHAAPHHHLPPGKLPIKPPAPYLPNLITFLQLPSRSRLLAHLMLPQAVQFVRMNCHSVRPQPTFEGDKAEPRSRCDPAHRMNAEVHRVGTTTVRKTPVSYRRYGTEKSEGGNEPMAGQSGSNPISRVDPEKETKDASWLFFAGVIGIFIVLTILAVKGIG